LMSYLEAFHAKTSQQLAKELESLESAQECGNICQELLAKYDPNTSLWKTPQCLLEEDLAQSLEIWPKWGSMQNGVSYQQPKLERITSAVGSGLWPTPTTPSGGGNAGGSGATKTAKANGTYIPSSINPNLYEWLMGWPQEWTDLKPLAMDKFHKWQQLHLSC